MTRRREGDAYPTGQYHTGRLRSVCMWPGCHFFAVSEVRSGAWLDGKTWVCLCTKHRSSFDGLSWTELKQTAWSERRKMNI